MSDTIPAKTINISLSNEDDLAELALAVISELGARVRQRAAERGGSAISLDDPLANALKTIAENLYVSGQLGLELTVEHRGERVVVERFLMDSQDFRPLHDVQIDISDYIGKVIEATKTALPLQLVQDQLRSEFKHGQLSAFAGLYSMSPNGTLPTRAD